MLGFEKDYPDAKRILLDTNYRCGRYIVEASLNLISHNRERFDKKIIAASKSKAPVTFADFENRRDENIFLIRDIDKSGSCIQRLCGAFQDKYPAKTAYRAAYEL